MLVMLLTFLKLIPQLNSSLTLLVLVLRSCIHLRISLDYKGIVVNTAPNDAIRQEFVTVGGVG